MSEFEFKKAEPQPEFARIALSGPSSSGKTVSAIRMALGMVRGTGKRVCLIDTENKRALKYSRFFDFDHVDFQPPFASDRYLEVILKAASLGYGAVIVDQATNEHEGEGGMLEQHENFLAEKCGNDFKKREQMKFTAWIAPKRKRNQLIQRGIQRVNADLILCFRAKEKIELRNKIVDGKKKIDPVSIGWSPIGGEEFPFEMLTNMILPPKSQGKPDWDLESSTINSLDRDLINLLHNVQQIDENFGAELKRLINPQKSTQTNSEKTPEQIFANKIAKIVSDCPPEEIGELMNREEMLADLEKVKSSSQAAYDYIIGLAKKKQQQ